MKILKIASCTLVIAGVGYFVTQSYKRSDIAKRIETIHNPEKAADDKNVADRVGSLIWLKDNLVPLANDISHPRPITRLEDVDKGYIFTSNNTITIEDAIANATVNDIGSARGPQATIPTTASMFTDIARKIDTFITTMEAKLNDPNNSSYKNYFKKFDATTSLTSDESAIIEKLKGANEFCKKFLGRIDSAEKVGIIGSTNTVASTIKTTIKNTQTKVRDFAKNYFNLTLS